MRRPARHHRDAGTARRLRSMLRRGPIADNLAARLLALAGLTLTSLVVARTMGPAGVGALSLLRLLPWLVGVVLGGGLYGAAPYFLSGPAGKDPAYRATFPAIAVGAGVVGALAWVGLAPVLRHTFYPQVSAALVVLAGVTVATQLLETTAKTCSQGVGDLTGSNRMIVLEEALFVPLYLGLTFLGLRHYAAMVVALALGDLLNSAQGWRRLVRRGFLAGGRPSFSRARAIVSYGTRAVLSSIALLLNARLDFAIVATIAGPTPLGIYAVASRYSELLRLPSLAMNYVLYPAYAAQRRDDALEATRHALRRMAWVPAAVALPMAALAPLVLPGLYGSDFRPAVVPAWLLLVGLAGGGATGIVSAYLYAVGRPGAVSAAQGLAVVVTVVLDLSLIPHYGITGAAVASTVAYLCTTVALLAVFRALRGAPGDSCRNAATADQPSRPAEETVT